MVQRNKGLNFTIRFKGGGNFASLLNPLINESDLIEDPVGQFDILTEDSISIFTETTNEALQIEQNIPAKAMSLDQDTVTYNGELVTVWTDAITDLQFSATTAEEPISGGLIGAFGGSEAIDFGSTAGDNTDGLEADAPTVLADFLHTGTMTFLAVVEHIESDQIQTVFDSCRGFASVPGFNLLVLSGGLLEVRVSNGSNEFVANPQMNISGAGGIDQIFVVRVSGGLCQLNTAYTFGDDILNWAVQVPLTGAFTGSNSAFAPVIGAFSRNTTTNRFTGSIGEICGWNIALTDSELTSAVRSLGLKWNLLSFGE